jgi:hypothetical protein
MPGTGADALALGGGDLHVIDVVPVPDGLEARIGEPEHQHALPRFFAQEVIDAVEVVLIDQAEEVAIRRDRGAIRPGGWRQDQCCRAPAVVASLEPNRICRD